MYKLCNVFIYNTHFNIDLPSRVINLPVIPENAIIVKYSMFGTLYKLLSIRITYLSQFTLSPESKKVHSIIISTVYSEPRKVHRRVAQVIISEFSPKGFFQ